MSHPFRNPAVRGRDGFTLVELMITLTLLAIVVAVITTVLIGSTRSKANTEARLEAQQSGRAISDVLAQDLRTAGYQVDLDASPAQPAFAYVDSIEIILNANANPYPDTLAVAQGPQALNPSGSPLPPKLNNLTYKPPVKYRSGAECIRYTLDLNNDGVVDAADQSATLAAEAARTPNPDDYVLARAVYGDSSGNVAGNNGGSLEKVGLIRMPGGGVPALYTVYLGTNPTPWDWSDGPIPADRLDEITRIQLKVTTEARRKGRDGTYPRATLTTEINSIRNAPNAINTLYTASGWVFNDQNRNTLKDAGEPGVPNAMVRLGSVSVAVTNDQGYYSVQGPPGQYMLRQTSPEGFAPFAADSIAVDFLINPADVIHAFADTSLSGGWLRDTCWVDNNTNGVYDSGDVRVDGITVSAAGVTRVTDGAGAVSMFLPVGSQTVTVTPTDSLIVASTNPTTVNITNGGTVVLDTRMIKSGTGNVRGTVFRDTNKNGTLDLGESGIAGAWVGVTSNSGQSTLAFVVTDNTGTFDLRVPNNMPAATNPYTLSVIPPGGYYPTGPTAITPIWLSVGQTVSGQNFGMSTFTVISLNADRVLSLSSGNLLEKDWQGNDNLYATKAAYDRDLVLGSEYVSNPNVSVWFNQMPDYTFDPDPTYQRNAQSSALSVSVGPLDSNTPTEREDVVTGLARKASGNIAVWLTQNSSGNLGYLVNTPTLYQTSDFGDVNSTLLMDVGGGGSLDLLVGTTGTANRGVLETWINNGNGAFARDEIYPPNGSIPGGWLGEVKAMGSFDVTGDGVADLILGTKTGSGTGRIVVLRNTGRIAGARFTCIRTIDVVGEITSLTHTDVDQDGSRDLILGTRVSSVAGNVQYWHNDGSGQFSLWSTFVAPGPVLSVVRGDFGGSSTRTDLAFGYRDNESGYSGGVRILYLDANNLPAGAVDPAGGTHSWMAPALNAGNFNYRLNPTTAGTQLTDLAVATKTGPATGALLVFIR